MTSRNRLIVLTAIALLLTFVVAGPAAGGPDCDKNPDHPHCPEGPPSSSVSVSLSSDPMGVHEFADVITYSATLENDEDADLNVTFDRVEVAVNGGLVATLSLGSTKQVAAGASVTWDQAAWISVGEIDSLLADGLVDDDDITATGIFTSNLSTFTAISGSTYLPDPPCGFVWVLVDGVWEGTATIAEYDACIVTPPEEGIWTVSVLPFPTPTNPKKPVGLSVTSRDHIPGNWCILPDGSGGNFSARWRVGDPPLVGQVYFPGPEGMHGDGVCYAGGSGGTEWFPIGNPDAFYLVTRGAVTFSKPAG